MNLPYSDLINTVDKDNLEKDLLAKSEECFLLVKQVDDLAMGINDRKEEILILKMELERKGSFRTSSSCGSLADEIDAANLKLENVLLKEEV